MRSNFRRGDSQTKRLIREIYFQKAVIHLRKRRKPKKRKKREERGGKKEYGILEFEEVAELRRLGEDGVRGDAI